MDYYAYILNVQIHMICDSDDYIIYLLSGQRDELILYVLGVEKVCFVSSIGN